MTCIADANVLFPLLVGGHGAHASAWRWWEQQPDGSVGLCLLTRLAVLRLLTNRTAMNGVPISPTAALAAWEQLSGDPRTVSIEAEPVSHEGRFVRLVAGREPTPNLWTDAWLAALAQSLDYDLTTFDRGFRSFEDLKLQLLTATGYSDTS
jgi:toxin-antitoxin system PIN domain toxin